MPRALNLYEDYSREEVHDVFAPNTSFASSRGDWGLRGLISLKDRPGDYVFFVTYGQEQAGYVFDEGVSEDGVLVWQSEPQQDLDNPRISRLIQHDELRNTINLFLRTKGGVNNKYTYLGRLKYLSHDTERSKPVHFQWQILGWDIPQETLQRIGLNLLPNSKGQVQKPSVKTNQLVETSLPLVERSRGISTATFRSRRSPDYSERDARNRTLGRAGQALVLEYERKNLRTSGHDALVNNVVDISELEGDGAGYDIKSILPNGKIKYIEVKTTKGPKESPFFMSANEVAFAKQHTDNYYLYRVYEYDETTNSGKFYTVNGNIEAAFSFTPTQHRVTVKAKERL